MSAFQPISSGITLKAAIGRRRALSRLLTLSGHCPSSRIPLTRVTVSSVYSIRPSDQRTLQELAVRVRIGLANYVGREFKDFCGGRNLWEGQAPLQHRQTTQLSGLSVPRTGSRSGIRVRAGLHSTKASPHAGD